MAEQYVEVDVNELKEFPNNARIGNVREIYESLLQNGQYRPLVVNRKNNIILAGNHTFQAIKRLGWAKALVWYVDVDDKQAKQIVLVDNKLNDDATYDYTKLEKAIKDLQDVSDLIGTGYTQKAVDDLLASVKTEIPEPEVKEVEPKEEANVNPVLDIVLLLNDERFEIYKQNINTISEFYKINPTQAGLKAMELYAEKAEANEI
jgi:ParB-like chromosome segregation protein Spo0J